MDELAAELVGQSVAELAAASIGNNAGKKKGRRATGIIFCAIIVICIVLAWYFLLKNS